MSIGDECSLCCLICGMHNDHAESCPKLRVEETPSRAGCNLASCGIDTCGDDSCLYHRACDCVCHKNECADCGRPKNDPRFHLDAPGDNWGAALHWYKDPTANSVNMCGCECHDAPAAPSTEGAERATLEREYHLAKKYGKLTLRELMEYLEASQATIQRQQAELERMREAAAPVLRRLNVGDIGIEYKWEARQIRVELEAFQSVFAPPPEVEPETGGDTKRTT